MKKIIISVLSAALVFASCQKEAALVENGTKTVSFTATTPGTRTSFAPKDGDSYPVLWTGDEKVSVSYNMAAPKSSGNTLAASADSKTVNNLNQIIPKTFLNHTKTSRSPRLPTPCGEAQKIL